MAVRWSYKDAQTVANWTVHTIKCIILATICPTPRRLEQTNVLEILRVAEVIEYCDLSNLDGIDYRPNLDGIDCHLVGGVA